MTTEHAMQVDVVGDFSFFSPAGLLQLMCQEGRSALLRMWNEEHAGTIRIWQGTIVDAVCGNDRGLVACYTLLEWHSSAFVLSPLKTEPTEQTIMLDINGLLLEAARKRDERRRR